VSVVEVIATARIPIVKSRCAHTGIKVDVCFENYSGQLSSGTVTDFIRTHPEVRPLVVVLKHMLHQRSLAETYHGGVGSFLLTVLVTFHVARLKAVAETVDAKKHKGRGKSIREAVKSAERGQGESDQRLRSMRVASSSSSSSSSAPSSRQSSADSMVVVVDPPL